ncbi:hypothetical protein [Streptomyces sp. NBC_01618]|uniref:hypothetical protein n=1 Tax=Streptomyces sp. NBC_01618 TaxID=2975900 RepID=UPI00386D1941|nr:hypothetical protein OH735_11660 [Streptomyces sp. NBC_01618]
MRGTKMLGRAGAVTVAMVSGMAFGTAHPYANTNPNTDAGAALHATAAAPAPVACAEVRDKVGTLEGRITPNACAFMKRQITFGETTTGTPPQPGEVGHPRVAAYLDIFDPEATLWEAGGAPQRGHAVIGNSIVGSLRLVPDLRYRGTEVVADGAVVMFGQWNEVTIKGHKVGYPQIARNVLSDDGKTIQARRYYDRYTVYRSAAPELRNLFEGVVDTGPDADMGPHVAPAVADRGPASRPFGAGDITARLAAWNTEDIDALVGEAGHGRLTAPGLAAPLKTADGKAAYLRRLFDHADVRLKPGQVAFGRTHTFVEWHGTVTSPKGAVPFGIVERFGPAGEWELSFDTLPLIADQAEIDAMFQRLAQP